MLGKQIFDRCVVRPQKLCQRAQSVLLKRPPDAVEIIDALCQYQYLATVLDGELGFVGYCGCGFLVQSATSVFTARRHLGADLNLHPVSGS
ncbi:MAG: hypothetical protein QNJ82_05640 [Gammaproteobacteria bacterium]|nr:hypothetical protein [Gammaproteobacteria bacterium]